MQIKRDQCNAAFNIDEDRRTGLAKQAICAFCLICMLALMGVGAFGLPVAQAWNGESTEKQSQEVYKMQRDYLDNRKDLTSGERLHEKDKFYNGSSSSSSSRSTNDDSSALGFLVLGGIALYFWKRSNSKKTQISQQRPNSVVIECEKFLDKNYPSGFSSTKHMVIFFFFVVTMLTGIFSIFHASGDSIVFVTIVISTCVTAYFRHKVAFQILKKQGVPFFTAVGYLFRLYL